MISFPFGLSSVMNFWMRLGLILLIGLTVLILPPEMEAIATIHTHPETSDQITQRSLETLRDNSGQAWQLVFYKRVQADQPPQMHLRLVGFPARTALAHPQPLRLDLGNGEFWRAEDVTPDGFGTNVGEYDLQSIMNRIDSNAPLRFKVALRDGEETLVVPPFMVREWRQVQQWLP